MPRFYTGWVKIHRSINDQDNTKNRFAGRPIEAQIFTKLVELANYHDGKMPLKGQKECLKRGQLCTSASELQNLCARTRHEIRSALGWLIIGRQITSQITSHGTVITILDYNKFQSNAEDDSPAKSPASHQAVTSQSPHSEETKNLRNEELIGSSLIAENISKSCAQDILNLWNETWVDLKQVRKLSEKRRRAINTRLKEEPDLEYWRETMERMKKSNFCINAKSMSFDWLFNNDTNHLKASEGNYDNKKNPNSGVIDTYGEFE